jgi:carbon-monoxide dehydrogenase large subunit
MADVAQGAVSPRYAGTRVPRVEDTRLLTGRGTFVDDIVRPGMMHGCFVRSPFARARINGIDTSAALALPGVHAVFTAAALNRCVNEAWHAVAGKDVPDTPRPPLADGEVKFVGDPVALVVADSRYIAEDAVELVDVAYEPLPAVVDFTKAVGSDVVVHQAYPDNIAGGMAGAPPDEETFASAACVVSENIYQQIYLPVPIETRGMVVEWSSASSELTVWASTQTPHELRAFAARLLGIPAQRVRVIMRDTGGGFGQKVVPMREDMCVMLAARQVPAALKWIEDRRENLMSAGQARHVDGTARMAFDGDGNILAADIDFTQDVGAYPTPYPVLTTAAIGMFFPRPYRVPKASFSYKTVFSNTAGLAAYRGPWQYETLAREILLDIAARKMNLDPVELRRRNLLRRDEMSYVNPNGMPYDHVAPGETFEQAVKILDHEGFRKEQADALAQGRYLGLGFSAYIEPTGAATGHLATEGATMRIEPTGKISVYVNGGSSGNSIETTVVQLTADAMGAEIDDVACIQGDTAVTPYGAGTQGSRSGPMTAGTVNGGRSDAARAGRRDGGPLPGHRGIRGETGAFAGNRPRRPDQECEPARPGVSGLLRAGAVAAGGVGVAGGDRALHLGSTDPLGQRHAHLHLRGRRDHRARQAVALHRQRRRRADDQSQCDRGPDRRRDRAGHRRRADGESGLRR